MKNIKDIVLSEVVDFMQSYGCDVNIHTETDILIEYMQAIVQGDPEWIKEINDRA